MDAATGQKLAFTETVAVLGRRQVAALVPAEMATVRRLGRGIERGALRVPAAGRGWAGVDEAGRGPLAGPVVAAAVALPPRWCPAGLDDSKRLSVKARDHLFQVVLAGATDVRVAVASHRIVDRINILRASLDAMAHAAASLAVPWDRLIVDGDTPIPWLGEGPAPEAVVDADATYACVAAASVVAKVFRDALMVALDGAFPGWALARHKGYATPEHLAILAERGPSPVHRCSFAPVRQALAGAPLASERRAWAGEAPPRPA